MENIDELIKKYCPNGVEFKKLGEVIEMYTGTQFNKCDMQKTGQYPCINGGIKASGYSQNWNESENTITISQGGSAGYVNWVLTKFWPALIAILFARQAKNLIIAICISF